MTRLSADQIELRYGAESPAILKEFSLQVKAGEFVGLVGPNGSGKSTLVRALSRSMRPSHGSVLLSGKDLYHSHTAKESARAIGTVPQTSTVAFDFTVREVVQMGRAPYQSANPFSATSSHDAKIVAEAMRITHVDALSERVMTTLSGGEQQRVLLSRALAQEPDVILLDEPTAHLDIFHQTQVLDLVRTLAHDTGKAVLAVLHDLNLAANYCDRLILLNGGHIVAQGTPANVLTAPNVQQVYGARVWVRNHPTSGRPFVLSLPEQSDFWGSRTLDILNKTIHVICGGGTGAGLLVRLKQMGYGVTAGALNAGDTDQEAAEMLGVPYVRESPFTALSPEAVQKNTELVQRADAVIVTDVPFGMGNLPNLQSALEARFRGAPVICIQSSTDSFIERDFTLGEAARIWHELRASGAIIVGDLEEAVLALTVK